MDLNWGHYLSDTHQPANPIDSIEILITLTVGESQALLQRPDNEIERRMSFVLKAAETSLVPEDGRTERRRRNRLVKAAGRKASPIPDSPDAWLQRWGMEH